MARSGPSKEAQARLLEDAAKSFAPLVKTALELWLHAAEELPRNAQDLDTRATTHLVHAALQQAPWRTQDCESKQVAWLTTNLPGISTAMHNCVRNHLVTRRKRINILDSFSQSKQLQDAQSSARLDAEREASMLVEVLSLVVLLILPIAAICNNLSSVRARINERREQRACPQQRWQQLMRPMVRVGPSTKQRRERADELCAQVSQLLGSITEGLPIDTGLDELLEHISGGLEEQVQQSKGTRSVWVCATDNFPQLLQLHLNIPKAHMSLEGLGVPVSNGPPKLLASIYKAQGLAAAAGAIWVHLMDQFQLSNAESIIMWKHLKCHMVECQGFFTGCSPGQLNEDVIDAAFLGQGQRGKLTLVHDMPRDTRRLLQYFKQRAEAANNAAALQQQLALGLGSSDIGRTTGSNQCSGEPQQEHSRPGDRQQSKDDSVQPAAGVGQGDRDADLNDIQSLLRQMYGHTV